MATQLEQLNTQIATIRSNIGDIGNLPDKVDQFCGVLAASIRAGYVGPGVISVFTSEKVIDDIYDDRDKINVSIKQAWNNLDRTDPDLEVPANLLVIADEWRNLKGNVQAAGHDFNNTNLSTTWEGDAAAAYVEVRTRQALALKTVPEACDNIAKSLEALAATELQLYIELATKSREMVTEVTDVVGKVSTAVGGVIVNPFAVDEYIAAMSALVLTVENMKTLIMGVVSAVATSSAAKIQENNMIGQSYSIIDGLPYQKWPKAVSEAYTGGLGDVIGDATTSDGDESGWNPGTTVVVAR
ncbi:WXG100 family type VII secretion target [Nocardia fluminea]|uniref:WXG100 family type VII secretion target n=1 Tax=Nocardia fluminea TaxID=134984 RepID=UPI0033E2C1E5